VYPSIVKINFNGTFIFKSIDIAILSRTDQINDLTINLLECSNQNYETYIQSCRPAIKKEWFRAVEDMINKSLENYILVDYKISVEQIKSLLIDYDENICGHINQV
jgi:hypothetical protein